MGSGHAASRPVSMADELAEWSKKLNLKYDQISEKTNKLITWEPPKSPAIDVHDTIIHDSVYI